jgi:hypothetical protein
VALVLDVERVEIDVGLLQAIPTKIGCELDASTRILPKSHSGTSVPRSTSSVVSARDAVAYGCFAVEK